MPDYQDATYNDESGSVVGSILGAAAQISAYEYFLLRGRQFRNIATRGIPQGVFGLKKIGRALTNLSGNARIPSRISNMIRPVGGFMAGTLQNFGQFSFAGLADDLPLSTRPGAHRIVREAIARLPLKQSLFPSPMVGRHVLAQGFSPGLAAGGMGGLMRRGGYSQFARASIISGVGRIAGRVLPVVNAFLLGKLAMDLAGSLGSAVGTTIGAATTGLRSAIANIRTTEFGGSQPIVFQMSAALTERQRALQAIQGSSLNARTFLGNEAQFYSETY